MDLTNPAGSVSLDYGSGRAFNRQIPRVGECSAAFHMASKGDCFILLYHRIRKPEEDIHHLDTPTSLFESHLRFFKKRFRPMGFEGLVSCLKDGAFPENAIVITFDDGYRNCFQNAKPLLETYGIPAIFFVVSDYVGKRKEYWWDELVRITLATGKLPPLEDLEIPGGKPPRDPPPADRVSGYPPLRLLRRALRPAWGLEGRLVLLGRLVDLFRRLEEEGRDSIRRQLLQWANLEPSARESYLPMDELQIRQLAAHDLFTVGSHTKTHPVLLNINPSMQREEIHGSLAALQRIAGKKIHTLAYPHGVFPVDYDGTSVEIARSAGLQAAFGVLSQKPVSYETRFELPRFSVPPVNPHKLEDMIRFWRRHYL